MQAELFDPSPHYTVTSLTRRLRSLIENETDFQDIWVEGEISNQSRPSSGHIYFTIKDSNAQLRCVMWRSDAARLKLELQDGMAIEVHGNLGLYEAGGQYQLYTDLLRPLGEGALYAEFLRLKTLLEAEGLFNPERKRIIPEKARRIGVVTSPTGAALRDIIDTIARRYPLTEVIVAATPVQGEAAPARIVQALEELNSNANPDVIILARGGGSMEDLWAFNSEEVVRAVAESKTPVITGVGHETDFTLVDFSADLRAPTPTAAAELATQITILDLQTNLKEMELLLRKCIRTLCAHQQEQLAYMVGRWRILSPMRYVLNQAQRLDEISRRLREIQSHRLSLGKMQLAETKKRLESLSPMAILERGYAVVTDKKDGNTVRSIAEVHPGDEITIRVRDGDFPARVTEEQEQDVKN